jgi:hypothetical protein
MYLGQQEFL